MDLRQLRDTLSGLRDTATRLVRRHAAIYAPDVPLADVVAICTALGDISIDEAVAALDRLQEEHRT
jgi:hypothetical protein